MGDRQTKGILTPTHPHAKIYLFLKKKIAGNVIFYQLSQLAVFFLLYCRTDKFNDYQKRYESSQEMVEMVALYQKWMAIEEKKRDRERE